VVRVEVYEKATQHLTYHYNEEDKKLHDYDGDVKLHRASQTPHMTLWRTLLCAIQ